jgi:hypothetical protein
MSWWRNFALSMPVIIGWAMLSWWIVEKPALNLRGPLLALEDIGLRFAGAIPLGRRLLPYTGAPQRKKVA